MGEIAQSNVDSFKKALSRWRNNRSKIQSSPLRKKNWTHLFDELLLLLLVSSGAGSTAPSGSVSCWLDAALDSDPSK
jgi:hypothetical protein